MLAGVATLVVGIRSTQNYRRLHLPLSRHFAISGFLAAIGLFLYSIPFLIIQNTETLQICLALGRAALDAVAFLQFYLIWYLTSLKKYPLRWFIWPLAVLGIIGYTLQLQHIFTSFVGVENGVVIYSYHPIYRPLHLFSLLIVFTAGVILVRSSFMQKELRGKVRLLSIAILYICAALADMYSTAFLGGLNNSPVVLIGYIIAAGVFLFTTLVFAKSQHKK